MSRLYYAEAPIDVAAFDRADRDAALVVLSPRAVAGATGELLDRLVLRRSVAVAVGSGALLGFPLAVSLFSDYFAIEEGGSLDLGSPLHGSVAAGVTWRVPDRARRVLLGAETTLTASRAIDLELCDALVPQGSEALEWTLEWLGKRSLRALLAAATLIRSRGGDVTERAEFGRMFGAGEPQRGLRGFLDKQPVDFLDDIEVVTL